MSVKAFATRFKPLLRATCMAGFLLGFVTSSLPALADTTASSAAPVASKTKYPLLEARLKVLMPNNPIDAIEPSEIPGLYAVFSGRAVIYIDQTGKYVINGHIFNAESKQDLTATMIADLNLIDIRTLPLTDSFSEVRGNGKNQLYVFSDPDCPYCKDLEHQLTKLTDVTVHVFLFPLVSIHPNARTNAIGVWCSADRSKAWQDKMLNDVLPAPASCDSPVERNTELAAKLGISGTPTLIFPDGKMFSGTMPADQINTLLGGVQ